MKKIIQRLFRLLGPIAMACLLMVTPVHAWVWESGYQSDTPDASQILTDTTDFNGNLSAADDNVQDALDTLDELIAGGVTDQDYGDISVSGGVWSVDANSIALSTDTTGDYVASLVAGTAIDVGAAAEGGTPTVDFDATELGTTTFGSGSSIVWTFNASGGTDPSFTFGDGLITTNTGVQFGGSGGLTLDSGNAVRTSTSAGNTALLQAYDLDTGPGYITFATLTANNTPTFDLATSVTKNSQAIVETAGRSLTKSSVDILADAELYTDTKCIYFENPVAGDDFKSIWYAKQAATITSIWAESDQTVTFMLQVDDGSPADVDSVDLAPAAGTAEDTSLDGDTTMAAGDRLDLATTSVASTPTWCSICFTFSYDD